MRFATIVLALAGIAACDHPVPPVDDQSVRPAKLHVVTGSQPTITHRFVGRLDAAQTVDLAFEVSGALAELPVREGQAISAGTLIAALDPTDFALAVQKAEIQLRLAMQDLQRKRSLVEKRGISQSLVDDARAAYDLGRVQLEEARERLAKSRIVAPFDAYVARRYVDNRTRIRTGDNIVRLFDLNQLKVLVSVPEQLMLTATADRVASVTAEFDALPGESFALEFAENTGEANPVAQTFSVTFLMDRPPQYNLLPGMTAQVNIELRETVEHVITIPAAALVSAPDGRFFVWVYDPDTQHVSKRIVQEPQVHRNGYQIGAGLEIGDTVVAAGASQLQEGMRVREFSEAS